MRPALIALTTTLIVLGGCGSNGSADSADDTSVTPLNGAALMEGTTNDASALETAAEPENSAPAAAENTASEGNAL